VGFKSMFLNRRLRTNIGYYYSDYSDRLTGNNGFECLGESAPKTRRLTAAECPPGGSVTWGGYITTPAKLQGLELELTAEPFDDMLVNVNAGYNDYKSGVKTLGAPGFLFSGNLIQPRTNMSAGAQYRIRFVAGNLTPRIDWQYQSKQTFSGTATRSAPLPADIIGGTGVFNGRLTYDSTDGKWSSDLAITNLSDKFYRYAQFNGSGFATTGVIAPPRQYLLSIRRNFGGG
jgi:iron complex outermembrane receptor protein